MSNLIDRDELYKALSQWDWQDLYLPVHFKELVDELPAQRSYEDGVRKGYEDAVRNYAKTALTQWVPVSERLPDDGREVWVTIKGYDVIYVEEGETLEQALERISRIRWVTKAYWSEEEHGWNNTRFGCPLVVSPIAWMPMKMPEPYTEDGQRPDECEQIGLEG